jgi:HD-GYP domain-containing protein (c-di-GMP phosphodiesterase class II)
LIVQDELKRLREALAEQRRLAAEKELQLERYASDLRETFKAERSRSDELQRSYVATVRALTNAVEARDAYTGKHAERVAAYGLELTTRIDPDLAAEPEIEFGFLLHDVGKVAIPDGILHKPEPLSDEERALMNRHPLIGSEILHGIPFLGDAGQIVRSHHERYDGTGYPDRLRGEEIPLAARIFSVCDALDAMTAPRPYRDAMPVDEAFLRVQAETGRQFDPAVVQALERAVASGEIALGEMLEPEPVSA